MVTKRSFIGIAIFAASLWLSLSAETPIAENGGPLCSILHSDNALEKKAATQLAAYLNKITGGTFKVVPATKPLPDTGIFVGSILRGPRAPRQDEKAAAERQHHNVPGLKEEDGFVIRTVGRRMFITGGSPAGTMYGVYGFLEEVLGCRWWSHKEEDVPSKPTISIGNVDLKREPAFAMHHMMNLEAQSKTNDFKYKGRGTGRQGFTGSHNMYKLMAAYGKEHPEIYPQGKDGKRKPNNLHLCYLATDLSEALAEVIARQVEAKKGNIKNVIYFAGMGDW
ncbi:MAG: hypothetical protein QF886_16995, partial [Planctomycetota bacterium]|nr:hypothetical protein [Planctomycetota bacterium]